MGNKSRKNTLRNNYKFTDTLYINNETFIDYLERFKKIALSMFEWVNLPRSMNARYIELSLYYNGQACLLKDENVGFINTRCCSNGNINIYGLPTSLNCYSYGYQTNRKLYSGLNPHNNNEFDEAILIMNNWERIPTAPTLELFALRLYEAERTADVNIKAQKTPVLVVVDETQRVFMENLYNQYNGNQPFIFGDKKQLNAESLRVLDTKAPFITDKLIDYKKEIWNEALTFLGINNIMLEKKERLVTDEANSNNELINLNLQSYLAPRQQACKEFNEKFKLKGTKDEISIRVRSDLHNVIKQAQSIVTDMNNVNQLEHNINKLEGDKNDGKIYNGIT